jgi:hypothetical protein
MVIQVINHLLNVSEDNPTLRTIPTKDINALNGADTKNVIT